jgi:hypothetical protein
MVTGSRSIFHWDALNPTVCHQVVLKGACISLDDIQARFGALYCLLKVNNLGRTNPQGHGQPLRSDQNG